MNYEHPPEGCEVEAKNPELIGRVIHGDCFDIFPTIKEKVNLVFVDLPYGQTDCQWDIKIDLAKMWEELKKITADNAVYVFTCTSKFGYELIASNPKMFSYDLVWEKSGIIGFLNAKIAPLRKHEMLYIFYRSREIDRRIKDLKGREYAALVKQYLTKADIKAIKADGKYGYICHFFSGPDAYQFHYPAKKTYSYLIEKFKLKDMPGFLSYDEMLALRDPKDYKESRTYNPQMTKGKPYSTKGNPEKKARKLAIYSTKIKPKKAVNNGTRYPVSILKFKSDKEKLHPTQKPQSLCEWVIKTYSNPGELVLDFCAGSGSTAVACRTTKRAFICIEKEKKYYNMILKRLNF